MYDVVYEILQCIFSDVSEPLIGSVNSTLMSAEITTKLKYIFPLFVEFTKLKHSYSCNVWLIL
jgi:hypothetical protein